MQLTSYWLQYRKLLIIAVASIAGVLVILNIEWIGLVGSTMTVSNLRAESYFGDEKVWVSVGVQSDAFYALEETRQKFIADAKRNSDELREAVAQANATAGAGVRVARAIIVFLPYNIEKFNKELKALFLSVAVMRTHQAPGTKTDLIVGTPRVGFSFPESLGCTHAVRSSPDDAERCTVVEHAPLKERPGSNPLVLYSNYIDSMLVLSEFKHGGVYDVLLRADLDTFVTPGFGRWTLPEGLALVTGQGGYGSENANRHLTWVMKTQLGLSDSGLRGIGSTWVGHSGVMVAVAKLTVSAMIWLHTQEFSIYEKSPAGTDGWPYWHWPVLLLYGGHVAVNQIPADKVLVTDSNSKVRLDYGTASNETLPESALHLHCWHSDDMFSKFRFQMGQYHNLDLTPFLAMNSTASYAAVIAVSSDRLAPAELADIVNDPEKVKANEWLRVFNTSTVHS